MTQTLHFVLAAFLLSTVCAQEAKPLADAGISTCDAGPTGGGTSKWLTSRAGFSAAVELRVKIQGKGTQRNCKTLWVLHTRAANTAPSSITIDERDDRPSDDEWVQENSFEIEAWSGDGKMVLISQIEAQGDWDETTPIVYDFASGRFWRIPLLPLFEKVVPSNCSVVYRPLRFTEDERVVISASSSDTDREAGTQPCFQDSLWTLDFRNQRVQPLSKPPHKFFGDQNSKDKPRSK